jgi:hypothetical protein
MRIIPFAGVFVLASSIASIAMAQQPANPGVNTSAVSTPNTKTPNATVEGADNLTESQARARIEAAGLSNISLAKDSKGGWHGRALRGGTLINVRVDFQGTITAN